MIFLLLLLLLASISEIQTIAISAGSLTPSFTTNVYSYSALLDGATTGISFRVIAVDLSSNLTIVGGPLLQSNVSSEIIPVNVGLNTFVIQSSAENGINSTTYTFELTRERCKWIV